MNTWRWVRTAVCLMGVLAVPAAATAQETAIAQETAGHRLCAEWGITMWGLTYHPDRGIAYNNLNWGAGIRCYARPSWPWLGQAQENKIFVEADALRNSWRGLLVPVSAGVEYKVGTAGPCDALFLGAVVVGYYGDPLGRKTGIRAGPVPGFALGCGRFKPSVTLIPKVSREILAALAVSATIMF